MKTLITTLMAVALGMAGGMVSAQAAPKQDIVDTAVKAGNFTILAKALKAAGLVSALKSDGPFTVFAPTDEAFMRLPKGTIASLLKPENKDQLIEILKYHVVVGKVDGATAVTLKEAKALNGEKLAIQFRNAALFLNDSKVVATDIQTSNGVIHVIDSVLLPPTAKSDSQTMACEKILTDAVDVGVDLFNNGDTKSCATIYNMAVRAIVNIKPPSLDASELKVLEDALAKVAGEKDSRTNAWTLRYAMNATMKNLFD